MCPKEEEEISFLPVQNSDCKKYAICSNGEATEFECAEGALFSPDETKCVRMSAYNCPDTSTATE